MDSEKNTDFRGPIHSRPREREQLTETPAVSTRFHILFFVVDHCTDFARVTHPLSIFSVVFGGLLMHITFFWTIWKKFGTEKMS